MNVVVFGGNKIMFFNNTYVKHVKIVHAIPDHAVTQVIKIQPALMITYVEFVKNVIR